MKTIELTKGKVCKVDDMAYEHLSQWKWHSALHGGYAARGLYDRGTKKRRTLLMHRYIFEQYIGPIPPGMQIDHINQDKLDNRLHNLRAVTTADNRRNVPKRKNNPATYEGVYHIKTTTDKCWMAMLVVNGSRHYLGCYRTEKEGAEAYDEAAFRLCGEYACLNFPRKVA